MSVRPMWTFAWVNLTELNGSGRLVLEHARTERDKLPAYNALAEGLGLRERHKEALELSLKSIAIVANFPKRMLAFHLLNDMNVLKSTFRKKTDEEIIQMNVVTDKNVGMAVEILSKMWIRAYLSKEMVLSLLCMTRALRMTFQHGITLLVLWRLRPTVPYFVVPWQTMLQVYVWANSRTNYWIELGTSNLKPRLFLHLLSISMHGSPH